MGEYQYLCALYPIPSSHTYPCMTNSLCLVYNIYTCYVITVMTTHKPKVCSKAACLSNVKWRAVLGTMVFSVFWFFCLYYTTPRLWPLHLETTGYSFFSRQ
ncbi:hypothetical protein ACQKWADRAFT_110591 [Trichoderma austrokoningii]